MKLYHRIPKKSKHSVNTKQISKIAFEYIKFISITYIKTSDMNTNVNSQFLVDNINKKHTKRKPRQLVSRTEPLKKYESKNECDGVHSLQDKKNCLHVQLSCFYARVSCCVETYTLTKGFERGHTRCIETMKSSRLRCFSCFLGDLPCIIRSKPTESCKR
jgi:hypothetical protein